MQNFVSKSQWIYLQNNSAHKAKGDIVEEGPERL